MIQQNTESVEPREFPDAIVNSTTVGWSFSLKFYNGKYIALCLPPAFIGGAVPPRFRAADEDIDVALGSLASEVSIAIDNTEPTVIGVPLFGPDDVDEANLKWKASCGPAAFAAVFHLQMSEARECFPAFPNTNHSTIRTILKAAGLANLHLEDTESDQFPYHGLAFVQFTGGKWDNAPEHVKYRHTHWIAAAQIDQGGLFVYDINNQYVFEDADTGWVSIDAWETAVLPALLCSHDGADGYTIRRSFEAVL